MKKCLIPLSFEFFKFQTICFIFFHGDEIHNCERQLILSHYVMKTSKFLNLLAGLIKISVNNIGNFEAT